MTVFQEFPSIPVAIIPDIHNHFPESSKGMAQTMSTFGKNLIERKVLFLMIELDVIVWLCNQGTPCLLKKDFAARLH